MESNFADILEEDETVDKFVQVTAKGRGMAVRSRNYVLPIAKRFVYKHQKHLFEIQKVRRETEPAPTEDDDPSTVSGPMSILSTPLTTPSTSEIFNDDDWTKELTDIKVEEMDGEWRNVTLFRSKLNRDHVCLWFGGEEYEGIDPEHPYSYCSLTESLEDDEGFSINWRTVGIDQDSGDDDDEEDS